MPPWAQELALSLNASFVSTIDGRPSAANLQAVHKPAIPVPTMSGRDSIYKEYTIVGRT
jgi:hypothetical protein